MSLTIAECAERLQKTASECRSLAALCHKHQIFTEVELFARRAIEFEYIADLLLKLARLANCGSGAIFTSVGNEGANENQNS